MSSDVTKASLKPPSGDKTRVVPDSSGGAVSKDDTGGITLKYQQDLPRLPIPPLEDVLKRYLSALKPLQSEREHEASRKVVEDFGKEGGEGGKLHERLKEYAKGRASFIEEFWDESYLTHEESVVLNLNPFFILEDDPTPARGSQLMRATSLILASLGFVHDLRTGQLEPDTFRGTPLDMYQYTRMFGTSRIPTLHSGCVIRSSPSSRHIVVLRRGQFYYFDVLDSQHRPCLTERALLQNLTAIMSDAESVLPNMVAQRAVGVLTTENRKVWATARETIFGAGDAEEEKDRGWRTPKREERQGFVDGLKIGEEGKLGGVKGAGTAGKETGRNKRCLEIVDTALFVVCLDDTTPESASDLAQTMLSGSYKLDKGVQVGTCTNRWYDKLQIIVAANGAAGINFEHSGVDGHTVLRFVADVYTELILRFAKSINSGATTLFKAKLSPFATGGPKEGDVSSEEDIDTAPKKLEWDMTPELRLAVKFAETRLSDLICQNEVRALEFEAYGKNFMTRHGFSPDAFVQMAYQAAYFTLYGRIESVYEPAMVKAFLHGRTEAIRSVTTESVNFVKTYVSDAPAQQKIDALRKACKRHTELTKQCSQGQGQDRILYAMYCLAQKGETGRSDSPASDSDKSALLPALFKDGGYATLNHSTLSTSNCGNPALRLFGFGPTVADGFGIGYIIGADNVSFCVASKHRQTQRFCDTLRAYLLDVQRMLLAVHRQANAKPSTRKDDDAVVNGNGGDALGEDEYGAVSGYGFFDSGDVEKFLSIERKKRPPIGTRLSIQDY